VNITVPIKSVDDDEGGWTIAKAGGDIQVQDFIIHPLVAVVF
jgi:hypothetical protein